MQFSQLMSYASVFSDSKMPVRNHATANYHHVRNRSSYDVRREECRGEVTEVALSARKPIETRCNVSRSHRSLKTTTDLSCESVTTCGN